MASPEFPRPKEEPTPEVVRSGSLGSQLNKYVGKETKVPPGKEWAYTLLRKIPDTYKGKVTNFIMTLPYEDRQRAAEHLSGAVDAMGDQMWRSRYPEVEIQHCIDSTRQWLDLGDKNKELVN